MKWFAGMRPMRQIRQGFSLIELLVVIAIISIVAAMLLPGLGRAKESACRIQCMGNLKQLELALKQYVDENRNSLPQRSDFSAALAAICPGGPTATTP